MLVLLDDGDYDDDDDTEGEHKHVEQCKYV